MTYLIIQCWQTISQTLLSNRTWHKLPPGYNIKTLSDVVMSTVGYVARRTGTAHAGHPEPREASPVSAMSRPMLACTGCRGGAAVVKFSPVTVFWAEHMTHVQVHMGEESQPCNALVRYTRSKLSKPCAALIRMDASGVTA